VDFVVLSNIPKDLGADVEVVVGAPTSDPWSLPFGYKTIFADRVDRYDLFIYSEDDTLITERNIDAFVRVTGILPAQYIAGFLRYETYGEGKKFYSTMHAHYNWDPNSVLKIGNHTFAHYTNEHSACFILTREQLKSSIASGGFLQPARHGRYDMLCTAATDPYTQCGMKKVVCVSLFDEFCLHHLPNVYGGRIGVAAEVAHREIERLKALPDSATMRGPLFTTSTGLESAAWNTIYHGPVRHDILSLVPKEARRVLSVGCGCGSTESELIKKGIEVTGIPLDCVIQVTAEAKGVRTVPPDFSAARQALRGQHFDCILFPDVLHHLPDPVSVLTTFSDFLAENATVIISVPNFRHASIIRGRLRGEFKGIKLNDARSFDRYGLHFTAPRMLRSWLKQCGLQVGQTRWGIEPRHKWLGRLALGRLNGTLSRHIVVSARKRAA
jgi:2-polyprenyl-3-methyl-5-hydroxy-6-metoxy-1,4-benzoquinol methylase